MNSRKNLHLVAIAVLTNPLVWVLVAVAALAAVTLVATLLAGAVLVLPCVWVWREYAALGLNGPGNHRLDEVGVSQVPKSDPASAEGDSRCSVGGQKHTMSHISGCSGGPEAVSGTFGDLRNTREVPGSSEKFTFGPLGNTAGVTFDDLRNTQVAPKPPRKKPAARKPGARKPRSPKKATLLQTASPT